MTIKISKEKLMNEPDQLRLNILFGWLYGYSEAAIDFFLEGKAPGFPGLPAFIKYGASKISNYDEFLESGLCGSGYISYPQEIRDITDGKITLEEVIAGINERRLISTPYPEDEPIDGEYYIIDLTKMNLERIGIFTKYAVR